MAHLIEKRAIDPYYYEYLVDTDNEAIVDQITDDCVNAFRKQGFKTAVITEATGEHWLVSCIAFKYNQANQSTEVLSQKAELKTADSFQFSGGQTEPPPHPALNIEPVDPNQKPTAIKRLKMHDMEPNGFKLPDF